MASFSNPVALGSGSAAATGLVITEADSVFIEAGHFQVQIGGGATATWKIIRTTDDPASSPTWHDVEDHLGATSNTSNRVLVGHEAEGAYYNVNITAYTSGTLTARLSQGKGSIA